MEEWGREDEAGKGGKGVWGAGLENMNERVLARKRKLAVLCCVNLFHQVDDHNKPISLFHHSFLSLIPFLSPICASKTMHYSLYAHLGSILYIRIHYSINALQYLIYRLLKLKHWSYLGGEVS